MVCRSSITNAAHVIEPAPRWPRGRKWPARNVLLLAAVSRSSQGAEDGFVGPYCGYIGQMCDFQKGDSGAPELFGWDTQAEGTKED